MPTCIGETSTFADAIVTTFAPIWQVASCADTTRHVAHHLVSQGALSGIEVLEQISEQAVEASNRFDDPDLAEAIGMWI